jgi:S-(hydroxymethyl)glutathione dehydrogenase/alcohol dehydrogenase
MRAALLREVPGELVIEELAVDKPGPREVLIRTAAAGLCHSDLHFMEGKYPAPVPAAMGHESAGVVEAVGDQVTYVQPGDHVITCLSVYCGNCEHCLTGHRRCARTRAPSSARSTPASASPRTARRCSRCSTWRRSPSSSSCTSTPS